MSDHALSVGELERWLAAVVGDRCGFPADEVEVDRPLVDYGISSRDAVEFAGRLEDLLDRTLPSTLLWDHPTIQRLAAALVAESPRQPAKLCSTPLGDNAVAVIGIGCRLPGDVTGPEEFWRLLDAAGDAVGEVPARRWVPANAAADAEVLERTTRAGGFLRDIAGFDAEFFSISPREARGIDPQQRMVLEVGWEALEHAGISPDSLRGSATGVFVGLSAGEYGHRSLSDLSAVDAWSGTGGALSVAANRLSYALDLRGPSVAVDTACSSSLVAVHLGMQSLRAGESDLVIAAGANLLLGPAVTAAFHQMGVISPTGHCQPFSANADGIVRAEGAGVVVLKRLTDALSDGDRVLAVLRGSAVNQDGHSNGITAPNVEAQEDLLRRAYGSAGVDPGEVDYVEAHGTGTLLGDPIEARALGAVLGADRDASEPLLVGSVKSNLGHLEAAAGIVGLIKLVLSIGRRRIPASLHYTGDHPHIDFDALGLSVAGRATDWPLADRPARGGVSAFGFGGTNAHVVVEEAPPAATPTVAGDPAGIGHFLIAGADSARVREGAGRLADWLETDGSGAQLPDVAFTLARRLSGRSRAGVVARDRGSLLAGLRACAAGDPAPNLVEISGARRDAGPVWVFSGQGSQWPGMGLRLMREEPAFAAALRELDGLILREAGFSVCEELERGQELTAMERLQPVLFAVQVALSRLLLSYGAAPAAVVGHSLGEVAAAVAVGGLSPGDGAHVVALRSRLLATLAGSGSMALLELSPEELGEMLGDRDRVGVAAFNAPRQIAVAGDSAQIKELVAAVEARGLLAKLIKSTVPGHCMLVDPVVGTLREELRGLTPLEPHTRCYSTALEDSRAKPVFDAAYWAANIRRPVRFAQAIAAAAADGHTSFIEISPHPVLIHALIENVRAAAVKQPVVLSTGRRSEDESIPFHAGLTALLLDRGAPRELRPADGRLIDLPRTSWHHARHWLAPRTQRASVTANPLLGELVELPDQTRRLWRSELDPRLARGDERWLALSIWLEMARTAATETLPSRGAEVHVRDLVLHAPLALADRRALTTSLERSGPRVAGLSMQSRIGAGPWRAHVSATVETVLGHATATPARLRAPRHALLASRPSDEGTSRSAEWILRQGLEALVGSLGPAGDGAWLPRSVGHVRWLGDLDEVSHARMSLEDDIGEQERTATLQLVDAHGQVRLDLRDVTFCRVSRSELPMALPEKLLRAEWRPVDAPRAPLVGGSWLILGGSSDPRAAELAAGLRSHGAEARIGNLDSPEDFLRADLTLDGVVVLAPSGQDPEDAPSRGEELILAGTRIVRLLSERHRAGAIRTRLWFVTSGAAAVAEGDLPDPGPAAVRGLVRVLAYEHPELQPVWIDLDRDRGVEGLLSELAADDGEDEVAWRAGRRHVARLARPELDEIVPEAAATVHADGAYLVSGGLGGLGLLLARWLAERGAARVVLNGRSGPGPRAQEVLAELRELGCEVLVVEGDIAQPGVAERAVAACAAPGARFRGVVHAAAVIEDSVALRLDPDTMHRVWRAKAVGAWRVSAASEGFALDWWVGFSSAASLLGSPGQAAYAAANAFLDTLTAWRRARGLVASTINWGTWSQVGRAAERRADAVGQITPAEGIEALEALLARRMPAAGVIKLDPAALAESFPALARIPLFSDLVNAAGAPAAPAGTDWAGVAALDPAEAARRIDARVHEQIASVLGVASGCLDADSPLITLGLDSLLAVRIRNVVHHDFDVLLPPSLLLRGASINEVLEWLHEALHLSDRRQAPAVAPTSSSRVAPRDPAERLVAAAWERVLGLSGVGVTQDFHQLGGDDHAAIRVAEMLSSGCGRRLAASELLAEATIERQAALLREPEESTSHTPLRLLRAGASPTPLFLFHPGGGDTLVYRQLVDRLDPSLTVWGLDRLNGVLSVEQRAERYVDLMRQKQPRGPYLLAGWSFGGALAYETALRLRTAGELVELVAMIDTILPLPDPPGLSDTQVLELRFQRFTHFLEHNYGKPVSLPYARMARLDDEAQTDLMIETIVDAGLLDPAANAAIIRHQRASYLDVRALERYRPDRHDGPVVFYSARDVQTDGMRDPRFDRQDQSRGWAEVCGDGIKVVSVPGHHLSLLDPPNVEAIASHLDGVLSELTRAAA